MADALPISAFLGRALAVYSALMTEDATPRTDPQTREDIALTLDGDGDAFERIVRRYQDTVAKQMWRFTRDRIVHAELVHDVFVQAFMSLRTYGGRAPFIHWLRKIAVRVGYAWWRTRDREKRTAPETAIETVQEKLGADTSEMDAREAAELVHWVLDRLPPRDRLVLTLQYLEEKSVAETAQMTGWSEAMVKVQAWRARAKFRKLMDRLDEAGRR